MHVHLARLYQRNLLCIILIQFDQQEIGDIRKSRASLPISRARHAREWKMDYVIDVRSPSFTDVPVLIGATNGGDVALVTFPIEEPSQWRLDSILSGHEGIVRCASLDREVRKCYSTDLSIIQRDAG